MPERARAYEVAVLGAGCAGAAVAYALARRRIAPVIIDVDGPAPVMPAATAAPVQMGTPADVALALRGAERLPELQDAIGPFGYRRTGGIVAAVSEAEETMGRARADDAAAAGLPVRWLGRDETLRREPGVTDRVAGAVYCAFDGVANAGALARRLLAATTRFGGVAHLGCGYVGIDGHDGTFRIRAGRDEVVARRLVAASGEVLRAVSRQIGVSAPMRIARRRVCITERAEPLLRHIVNGIRQGPAGELVLDPPIAVMEDRPPIEDVRAWVEGLRRIGTAAVRIVPGVEAARIVHAPLVVAAEPADGRPIVGRVRDDVYLAIASADQAVAQAPLIGDVIADGIARNRWPDGMEIWSAARFAPVAGSAGTVQDSPHGP